MKKKKVFVFIITGAVMAVLCSITVFADGEVANAVSNTWTKGQRTDKIDRKRCSISRDRCCSCNTIVC